MPHVPSKWMDQFIAGELMVRISSALRPLRAHSHQSLLAMPQHLLSLPLECSHAGGDTSFPVVSNAPTTGIFKSVSVNSHAGCAIKSDGSIVCWGDATQQLNNNAPTTGPFTSISVGNPDACAVNAAGCIECWGSPSQLVDDVPTRCTFSAVSVGDVAACAT